MSLPSSRFSLHCPAEALGMVADLLGYHRAPCSLAVLLVGMRRRMGTAAPIDATTPIQVVADQLNPGIAAIVRQDTTSLVVAGYPPSARAAWLLATVAVTTLSGRRP